MIDFMMACGRLLVAEALQGDGQVGLRLAAGQLQPVLPRLAEEVVDRLLVLRRDRLVLQEEAAAVEVERDRWS